MSAAALEAMRMALHLLEQHASRHHRMWDRATWHAFWGFQMALLPGLLAGGLHAGPAMSEALLH